MDMAGTGDTPRLSYVIPAHNSSAVIEGSLKEVADHLAGTRAEVIVVENGSTDDTPAILDEIAENWSHDVELRVLHSATGMGNALRAGIRASRGTRLFLGADDIPFDFGDLDGAEKLDAARHPVVIGSKAHPASVTPRGLSRRILTVGFMILRRLILRMRTRDPQGTFILDGDWARKIEPRLTEQGFLLSTELAYLAERQGIRPVEIPVRLRDSHDAHGSRVRLSDPIRMGLRLFTLRRGHPRTQ